RSARLHAARRPVRRRWTCAPQPESTSTRAARETVEQGRIPSTTTAVEVRCRGADRDEPHVYVEPVADADHVTQQAPVFVAAVGRRLDDLANERPPRPLLLRGRG